MAQLIQLRRDTAANWTAANPILANGETAFETNTKKLKIGDGVTAWNALAYFSAGAGAGGTVDATIIDGSVNAVSGNAVFDALTNKADLVGGKVPVAQLPSYASAAARSIGALRFDSTKQHHVNIGAMYKEGVTYSPKFFHEFLIAADNPSNGYFFSGGWGAIHPGGLHGTQGSGANGYHLTGNIWDGLVAQPDHASGDTLKYGKTQIYHVAFAYDGAFLYIFVDGICSGVKAYTTSRLGNNTHGASYFGGSEHSNYNGWLLWARFWEETLPFPGNTIPKAYRPEALPRNDINIGNCALLMSFDHAGYVFPDQSDGFDNANAGGLRKKHNGILSREGQLAVEGQNASNTQGIGNIFSGDNLLYSGSIKFLTEAGLPVYDDTLVLAPRPYQGIAPAIPAGLLAYDSFSRADQTWLFHGLPSLGSTEGGSLGALVWGNTAGLEHTWGILSGAAVCYNPNQNVQHVSHAGLGVAREVSVDRLTVGTTGLPPSGHEGQSGLCYGYVNQGTRGIVKCFFDTVSNTMKFNLIETVGGEFNPIFSPIEAACPANFTTITVKVEGTRRRLYTDASIVALIDTNLGNATVGAATKMGLFGLGDAGCARFKNFTVKVVTGGIGGVNPIADEFVFRPRIGVTSQALGIMVQGCATNSTTLSDWTTLLTIGGTVNDGVNNSRTIAGGVAYPFLRIYAGTDANRSIAEFEFRQAGFKIQPIASYGDGWYNQPVSDFDFNKALDGDAATFFASSSTASNPHAGIQVY